MAAVSATDGDAGSNARIRYAIVGNGVGGGGGVSDSLERDLHRKWFSIDADTGLIVTKAPLDRETASEVILNVTATDDGAPPRANWTTVRVTFLDVNDQAPRCGGGEGGDGMKVTIRENRKVDEIGRILVEDGDEGEIFFEHN